MQPVFRPRARAPLMVAISRAWRADTAVGSRETPLWSRAASLISSNISWLLLEATPSVPRATFTPASSRRGTGATPEASFRLDTGLWTAVTPRRTMPSMSSRLTHTQWAARPPFCHTP